MTNLLNKLALCLIVSLMVQLMITITQTEQFEATNYDSDSIESSELHKRNEMVEILIQKKKNNLLYLSKCASSH